MNKKIVIGITGASGSIYAKRLLYHLIKIKQQKPEQISDLSYVLSANAADVWKHELQDESFANIPGATQYDRKNFMAPFASGSAQYDTMVICPCSMGTMGRIAGGISDELITRAADVMLKERRKLILVARDTPLNLIHLRNMVAITEAGGIICPASPSFYSLPTALDELADTVVLRVLDLMGLSVHGYRWGTENA